MEKQESFETNSEKTDKIPVSFDTFFPLGGKIVWKKDDESDVQ